MGVKKKKSLGMSTNAYRWKKVEEKLIQKGYVCSLDNDGWRVWVDCVSSGTDIVYSVPRIAAACREERFLPDGDFYEQHFQVLSSKDPYGAPYKCNTIEHAINVSRSGAR